MLVVFDWDGTIIDSTGKIVASMQEAAKACQVEVLEYATIRNIIGLGLPEALLELYPGQSLSSRQQIQRAYSEAFIAADSRPCNFFDGVEDALDNLQSQGYKIAVATGKSRRGLDRVLARLGWEQRFDATRTADETASKPDPKMLLELMGQMSVANEATFMVGDTEYDLAMAVNAAVPSVGVSYGAHAVERLQKHQPIAIIDAMSELVEVIG